MIGYYRTRVVTVEAVQWTGENIESMQALLAPGSPLWTPTATDVKRALGVYVDKATLRAYDTTHELQHADVNDWVVKYPSGRVAIIKAAHFEEYFEPTAVEIPPYRPEFQPLPTHRPADALEENRPGGDGNGTGNVADAALDRQPDDGERPSLAEV